MNTPLLADDGNNDRPSLSSGPWIPEEPSDFSRLLEQRSMPILESLALHFGNTDSSTNRDASVANTNNIAASGNQSRYRPRGPLLITVAGTCSLLHLGFLWGSYMSDVWCDTSANVWTNWQRQYLPSLQVSLTLKTTNLASFMQDLDAAGQYPLLIVLWFTSLLLPCLFMILAPSWIIHDANHAISFESRRARSIMECTMRWALFVFYILVLFSVVINSLQIMWTGTVVSIRSRAMGGWACFPMGVASALLALMLLRLPQEKKRATESSSSLSPPGLSTETLLPAIIPPPPSPHDVFEPNAWQLLASGSSHSGPAGLDHDEAPAMTVLEDGPPTPVRRSQQSENEAAPQEEEQQPAAPTADPTGRPINRKPWCSDLSELIHSHLFKTFLVYQMGLLSIILWAPSLFLPVMRWTYTGILADLDDKTTSNFYLTLWELPLTLWVQGVAAGTAKAILILSGLVLLLTVYVIPTAAMTLACGAWFLPKKRPKFRAWLYCLHPGLGSIVFCMAILAALPALAPWSQIVLSLLPHRLSDEDGLNQESLLQNSGLAIEGGFRPGMWLFILQTLALEVFVTLTLRWS